MIVLACGLLFAALAGIWFARRMVVPIRALATGAARIGGGDLDHRIDIRSGDEVQSLADSFNEMGGRLKAVLRRPRAQSCRPHPRAERGAGAADGDQRDPERHQPLTDRCDAGFQCGCRSCGAVTRVRLCGRVAE